MITTPLGQINIYTDGSCLEYKEISHRYDRPPVKGHPIAGCYRIHGSVPEVVFGIAWATDYEGKSDVRTWFAADPTLDRE